MARTPKPWYRKFTNWYVTIDGEQVNLGKNKKEAMHKFHELMANPQQKLTDAYMVVILDKFLEYTQGDRSPKTYRWYKDYLESFAKKYPNMLVADLKPFHVDQWASEGKATKDDCIAIKAPRKEYFPAGKPPANSSLPARGEDDFDVDTVVVQSSVFWNAEWGNALEIGFELRTPQVKNILWRDCDIIPEPWCHPQRASEEHPTAGESPAPVVSDQLGRRTFGCHLPECAAGRSGVGQR